MKTYLLKLLLILILFCLSLASYYEKTSYKGYSAFTVMSQSMEPSVKKGSIVIVDSNQGEYFLGDIITFKYPLNMSTYITHRIVDKYFDDEYYYVSKGDFNTTPDPWQIRSELIAGSVVFAIPYIGYLVMFIRSPIGLFSIIILPLGIILLIELDKIVREVKVYWDPIYSRLSAKWKKNIKLIKRLINHESR